MCEDHWVKHASLYQLGSGGMKTLTMQVKQVAASIQPLRSDNRAMASGFNAPSVLKYLSDLLHR